jgi:RHS repeat-associated protein
MSRVDAAFDHAYTYAGYRYDRETGLYYLNARYYVTGIGRFLTKDVYKGSADISKSLNRYGYSHGNPVNLVDLRGHDVDSPGMDLGEYIERKSQGLYPTGSYDTPLLIAKAKSKTKASLAGQVGENIAGSSADTTFGHYISKLPDETFQTEGNAAIRTYTPRYGVKALKGFSKYAGPVAAGALAFDLYGDYRDYRNSPTPYAMTEAMGISVLTAAAGVGAGIVLGAFGAPVIAVVIVGAGVGVFAGWGEEKLKSQI